MGSPEFALPTLAGLAKQYQVVGVVTQPDREAGRGRLLTPPPVKVLAQELGLPVIQPLRLKQPEALAQLQVWQPDLMVVAAFGQILRQNVLDLPRLGCINVHASLLPRWRGAAPIQAAILEGDAETGVSIMKMDAGVDTGAVLAQRVERIGGQDTAESLGERLAQMGADLLLEVLPAYCAGHLQAVAQDEVQATYVRMLKKEDGELRFCEPVERLERQVRAMSPWPGAFLLWQGQPLKVLRAEACLGGAWAIAECGQEQGWPVIGAQGGRLLLREVQPAGKKAMSGAVFLRGARTWGGGL